MKIIRRALDRWYRKHGRRPARKVLPWSAPLLLEPLEPRWVPTTFTVSNTNDSGAGSLRQAILDSNGTFTSNLIQFNITGSGVQTIALASPLPAITTTVGIEGNTQPGYAGTPLIEVNGAGVSAAGPGLDVEAPGTEVRGLVIDAFSFATADIYINANDATVAGNYIGTDPTGTLRKGASYGVEIAGGTTALIGGTTAADRNVISGNFSAGVQIDAASGFNTVEGNYIGTDPTGATATANFNGVTVNSAHNVIGGSTAGAGNVISGNQAEGIEISGAGATGNTVEGNTPGLTAGGAALGNGDGVFIHNSAGGNTVGGTTAAARNVLSGNTGAGVALVGAGAGNVVEGNYIGLDPTGGGARGNGFWGVEVDTTTGATIGGTAAGAANVISGNPFFGVVLQNNTADVVVQGNLVGLNAAGTAAVPNGSGVGMTSGANNNTVGGTTAAARNVIAGSTTDNVDVGGSGVTSNVVEGNYIGTNAAGTATVGSATRGVGVYAGAQNNTIGGTAAGTANVIVGGSFWGVEVYGNNTSNNVIEGNDIGTDAAGDPGLGNTTGVGIDSSATNNTIGGAAGNVISGNTSNGILIDSAGTTGNAIETNIIGLKPDGAASLPNAQWGVYLSNGADGNMVGAPGLGNVISGNRDDGIYVFGVNNTLIQSNIIGLDATGTTAVGNSQNGISVNSGATHTTIGGAAAADRNVISGNVASGITISGGSTTGTVVEGNYIGTNPAGTAALANNTGITITGSATGNLIGTNADGANDAAEGNVISGNTSSGVEMLGANNNTVAGNYLGTTAAGTGSVSNGDAIFFQAATGNVIGTDGSDAVNADARNIISGNSGRGVVLDGPNLVGGNWIGVDVNGAADGNQYGIQVTGTGSLVGTNASGVAGPAEHNVISSNSIDGLIVRNAGTTGAIIAGNYIGTDPTGLLARPNGRGMEIILGASNNTVGGTTAAARNVISANSGVGVLIADSGTTGNVIEGNYVGTDVTGGAALGNTAPGVNISGAPGNIVGGTAAGQGNIISANGAAGILASSSDGTVIQGNFIGTNATGSAALGNAGRGIYIDGTSTSSPVTGTLISGNLISGNAPGGNASGIRLENDQGSVVQGNKIGTDVTGGVALGNGLFAVRLVSSVNDTVGGTAAGAGNLLSGNQAGGVYLNGATGTAVQGNLIGTDATGTSAVGNATDGILLDSGATGNTIGGTTAAARNVISGNSSDGVHMDNGATGNVVEGNYVGTDATGDNSLGNANGVYLASASNTVGGTVAGAGNVIAGNDGAAPGAGYQVEIANTSGNVVAGNLIGLNAAGHAIPGATNAGVYIAGGTGNTVGGTTAAARNVVSGNVHGVYVSAGSANVVEGNYLGTDPAGTTAVGNASNGSDVILYNTANNTVGGTAAAARNVISGGFNGVYVLNPLSTGNVIEGNYIGTDPTGTLSVPNVIGITMTGTSGGNTVGGLTAVPGTGAGNLISGNSDRAIVLFLEPAGDTIIGNAIVGNFNGIQAESDAGVVIGGVTAGAANQISGNGGYGAWLEGTTASLVQANLIGTNTAGTGAQGNAIGVQIDSGSTNNTVGGTTVAARNVISGNTNQGVLVQGSGTTGNVVEGNYIGINAAGNAALANAQAGVDIGNSAANNTVGGTSAGAGNVISGNNVGVSIGNAGSGNVVLGNFIGTDATGSTAVGNGFGIAVGFSTGETIGGTTAGARNVISGNGYGINIDVTFGLVIQGNWIGLNAAGTAAVPNAVYGIQDAGPVPAENVLIGGTTPGAGNVISGNTGIGILSGAQTTVNFLIQGNLIGTNPAGTSALGSNNQTGIQIQTDGGTTVGGTTAAARNIISGNGFGGIQIQGASAIGNTVEGNYVGTDITGTTAVGNGIGVVLDQGASNNTVGGTTAGAGNVISGNGSDGIDIDGSGTTANVVAANFIGTNAAGTGALANGANGVQIDNSASNNTVGGAAAGAGNIISGNGQIGVYITGSDNSVEGNYVGTDVTGTKLLANGANCVVIDTAGSGNTIGGVSSLSGGSLAGAGNLLAGATTPSQDTALGIRGNNNLVAGNFIGTDVTGTKALGNWKGVRISLGSDNTIGGTTAGLGNLISGNDYGVEIGDGSSTGNIVEGNLIGTDVTGTQPLGNKGRGDSFGVYVYTPGNTVGGTTAGAGNVIAASADGITLAASTVVQGNWIGTNPAGSSLLGNTITPLGNTGDGILIENGASTIGGTTAAARNIISGNAADGVEITGSSTSGNVIEGNYIGTNPAGTAALGNGIGVEISNGASGNTVGGTTAGARNLISGNAGYQGGVEIDTAATGNVVEGNYIGTDVTGTLSLGNSIGIFITSTGNTVGGTAAGAGNVIAGNDGTLDHFLSGSQVVIAETSALDQPDNNAVEGNLIGLGATGHAIPGATNAGVFLNFGVGNTIGGTTAAARNVVSGNQNGVEFEGGSANVVEGNYVGTDPSGTSAVGNGFLGSGVVLDNTTGNTVGGTTAAARNVISGQAIGDGVLVFNPAATDNVVEGNYIGTDVTGAHAVSNEINVYVSATGGGNTIGGATATPGTGAGNLIAYSSNRTVVFYNDSADALEGNAIVGGGNGIQVQQDTGIQIGGPSPQDANQISGNGNYGVWLEDSTATVVQGNLIGTNLAGTGALGNGGYGLQIDSGSHNNTIGGTAAGTGNVIAFNGAAGVAVVGATTTGNTIRGNSIFSNNGLGIDLGGTGAALANDSLGHAGPNNYQDFPALTFAAVGASNTRVVGILNATAGTTYALDFYASPTPDPSGYGEGQRYLGSATVTTDSTGRAPFDLTVSGLISATDWVAATATDPGGNTSEFGGSVLADVLPTVALPGPGADTVGVKLPLTPVITDTVPGKTYQFAWGVSFGGNPVTLPDPTYVTTTPTDQETFFFDPQRVGSYQLSLTVTDNRGGFVTTTSGPIGVTATTLGITITGDPPGTPAPFAATVGQAVTLDGLVTDPRATAVTSKGGVSAPFTYTYAWSVTRGGAPFTLPLGTVTNAASFSFIPTAGGLYTVTLNVSDGIKAAGFSSVALYATGAPGSLIITEPGTSVAAGTLVQLQGLVTDLALRKSLSYHWTITYNGQPAFDETDATGVYKFPTAAAGNYLVTLTVTDDQMRTAAAAPVLVKASAAVPAVTITAPPTSPPGQLITLYGAASDADPNQPGSGSSNTYTLSWSVFTTAGTVTPPSGSGSSFGFTPSAAGLAVVTLTAKDQTGRATSATSIISVAGPTRTLTLTPPANPAEGGPLTWTASVSGGTAVSYSWTVFSPDGRSSTYNTGATNSLTLPNPALPGRYVVGVTASLSDGSTASAAAPAAGTLVDVPNTVPNVTITVPPPPSGHTSFQEGDTITLQGTAADPGNDLGFSTYLWTVTGPNGFSQVGVQSNFTFQPLAAGTYTATLSVRDSNGGAGTATAKITVIHVPPHPVLRYVGTNSDGTVSLVALVANPASLYTFSYTVSLNGHPYLTTTAGGASYTFRTPPLTAPTLVSVSVTDSAGASGSVTATVSAVAAGTASQGVSKTVTAADLIAGSDTALVLAQGYDTVTADPSLPASDTVTFVAVGAHNHFVGGATANVFQGDSGSNLMQGGAGPNTFYASGNDTAAGGNGTNPNTFVPMPTAGSTGNTLSLTAGASANTIDLSQESGVTLNLNLTTAQPFDSSGNSVQLSGAFQSVLGSAGADTLTASSGSSISGGGGNDLLMSNAASNVTLSASSGQATLQASGGSNVMLQGGKDTNLLSTTGVTNAMLVGGSGNNDSLIAGAGGGNVSLVGGSGNNDSLMAGTGNVSLVGGSGNNDSLIAGAGSNNVSLVGGSGNNDSLLAGTSGGNVSLVGGSGNNDSLVAGAGSNNVSLVGGSGNNDSLLAGSSNVSLIGGSGNNDSLIAGAGNQNVSLVGGSGNNDSLLAGSSNVSLIGGSGNNDSLIAGSGTGNVSLVGGSGNNDSLLAGSGSQNVSLVGGSGNNDSLIAGAGNSNVSLVGGSGSNDSLIAGAGSSNVSLVGGSGNNDSLIAGAGSSNVSLVGGSGNNDSLLAGTGNVSLIGGSGNNDSLVAGTGSGNVSLVGGSGNNDSLLAGSGSQNVSLVGGSGNNDSLLAGSGSNNVSLVGGSGNNDSLISGTGNVSLVGGSGNNDSLLAGTGSSNVSLVGGSGNNDSLVAGTGSTNVNLVGGLPGASGNNDSLYAGTGSSNVSLVGGSGNNDSLVAGTGSQNVSLVGGSGNNDSLYAGNSNVSLVGGSGNNDSLIAGAGTSNVSLVGGSGNNDSLLAGTGSSNVSLVGGSGNNDSLVAGTGSQNVSLVGGSGNNDSLVGGAGSSNVTLVGGSGSGDTLGASGATNALLIAGFGNSASLSASGAAGALLIGGFGSNDTVAASGSTNSALVGGFGNSDSLAASGGSNVVLVGGFGNNDSLSASGSANASLYGGTGNNDLLTRSGGGNNAYLFGQSGNNDSLLSSGGGTNVSLIGGSGNGLFLSDNGSVNALLEGGYGNNDSLVSSGGQNVSLVGGSGGNDSLVTSGGNDLTVYGGYGNNDSLTASGDTNTTLYGVSGGFDSLASSAGTNVTVIGGTGFDNTITDTNGTSDTLINGGNQFSNLTNNGGTAINLFGGDGPDILTANGGSNVGLYGENGANTYNVNAAGGSSTAFSGFLDDLGTNGLEQSPSDALEAGPNTIAFPTATNLAIDLSQETGGASVRIDKQAVATNISLYLVGLFNGVVGTPGADVIKGDALPCSLVGGGGNDTIIAGTGGGTLVAGAGNDSMVGGAARTVYAFPGSNLGSDTITQANATNDDAIDLSQLGGGAATLSLATTARQTVNPDLALTLTNATIPDVIGSPQGNTLTGNARDNHFTLSTGNNTITTGGGLTTVKYTGSALGTNVINTSAPQSTVLDLHELGAPIAIDLSLSTQHVAGGTVSVSPSAVASVVGTTYGDVLKGGATPVSLYGGGGQDSIVAGAANDYLQAGVPQVVLLDFDTYTPLSPGNHVYTQAERNGVQQRLQTVYGAFASSLDGFSNGVVFTQSLATAEAMARPTGGDFVTIFFNDPPAGGQADEVDFGNVDLGGAASIDASLILGMPNQPDPTSADFVQLSANLAAHELGHLFGLRHTDSFGPIGSGAYEVFNSAGQQVSGINPALFVPGYQEPAGVQAVSVTYAGAAATAYAPETPLHIMTSPLSTGVSRFDELGNIYFDEREAIGLSFDASGVKTISESAAHGSFATAQDLGDLPGLVVPNTLLSGAANYGKTFEVGALAVAGHIGLDATGHSTDDYYAFNGHAGDYMSFEAISSVLANNPQPVDTTLTVYDSAGNVLAFDDDELESTDSLIQDFKVPADGRYYVKVDSYAQDAAHDTATGNYELYMYSFNTGVSLGGGSTLVGGAGNDTMYGGNGNDTFTFPSGATGSATVLGGNGADIVDETAAPNETVTVIPAPAPSTITVEKGTPGALAFPTALATQSVAKGAPLHFSAAISAPGRSITYSLAPVSGDTYPTGAVIQATDGDFFWTAGDQGSYGVELVATASDGTKAILNVSITVTDVAPTLDPVAAQTVTVGAAVNLYDGVAQPVAADTYTYAWTVTLGSQTVATGSGQNFTFAPGVSGSYGVSLKVTDQQDGLNAMTTTTVTVNDVKPLVSPIPAVTARAGDTVALNGYYSYPGSASSLTLAWKVTDSGNNTVASGSGSAFSFVVPDAGAFTVTFTVTTASNLIGSAATTVTASDVAPTAALTPGLTITEGTSATIALSNPSDPAPAVTAAGFRYSFALSASGLATSYAAAGTATSIPFVGSDEGTYTVYGRIFDKNGGYTDYSTQVVVSDPQVVPTGGFAVTATKGSDSGSQTVATFTDPGGAEATGNYAATVNWGDGTAATAGTITYNATTNVFTVSGHHTYAEQGSYPVTVTLTHEALAALTVTDTATVTAPALVGTGGFSISATTAADTGAVTVATFTDPAGPDALATYSATIDWGDGHTSAGAISLSGGVFTVQGSHVYTAPGTPTIQVTLSHLGSPDVTVKDSATVINPALLATALPLAATRNAPTGLVPVATFTDPAGPDKLSAYSASISWGDTITTAGTIVLGADGRTFTVLGSHTYTEAGSYTVKVTVQHGAAPPAPTTVSSTAMVSNPAVVAVGGFTIAATPGVPFSGQTVATFTDPSGPDAAGAGSYTATIDWGDGNSNSSSDGTGTVTIVLGADGRTFTLLGSHTYATVTNDVITVTIAHPPSPSVSVTSTAVVVPSVLLLNPTGSGALTVSGSASVALTGALIVDSSSSSAITESGNASVKASSIQEVGGTSLSGNATISPKPTHLSSAAADPLAGLAAPTGGTAQGSVNLGGNNSLTINPGVYTQINVSGNAKLTLNPGVYILAGGGLTVSGNASLSGSGVTLYNTESAFPAAGGTYGGITLSGNGTFNLTAPTSGPYAGVVLFQARTNTRAIALSGNAAAGLVGTVYAPAALLYLSGNASLTGSAVVNALSLSGNAASTQAADSADVSGGDTAGQLLAGNVVVYVSDPKGLFTADELARIQDAVNIVDAVVGPYGVSVTETTDPTAATVVIDTGSTSAAGGYADGILGCYTTDGEITLIQGWDWYAGSDPAGIGSTQYDFQTTITHELGHALGLGESADPTSAMHGTLAPGTVIRMLTTADLNIPYDGGKADPQRAAVLPPADTAAPRPLAAAVVLSPATPAPPAAFLNVTLTPILSGGTAAVLSPARPVLVRTAAEAGSPTPPIGAVRSDATASAPELPDQPARGTGEDKPEPRTSPEPGPREPLPWPDQQDEPRSEPVDRFFADEGGRGLLADGAALPIPSQHDPDGTSLMTAASLLAVFALHPTARPAEPAAERKRPNWCRDEG